MAITARGLNRRGLVPRANKRTNSTRSALWTKEALAYVLKSSLYVGKMMHGDELFDGEHPRLVVDASYGSG